MDSRIKVLGRAGAVACLSFGLLAGGCAHRREVVYPTGNAPPAGLIAPAPAALGATKQMPVTEIEVAPAKIAPTLQMDGPH